MQILREITENDLGMSELSKTPAKYKIREAARAIVIKNGNIALMFVSKLNFHKLPGGGMDKGESVEDALRREIMEEVGSEINILGEVGTVIEYRDRWSLKQTSYCYIAESVGELKRLSLTKVERSKGIKLDWTTFSDAIEKVKSNDTKDYEGQFVKLRELTLLQKADEILNHSRC
jgi:8-oxo-dGTP diphosphatase